MCYLIRERQAGAAQSAGATPAQNPQGLRPRWIGAIGATLIGGLTLAAIFDPPQASMVLEAEAPAPVAERTSALPGASGVEAGLAQIDDGVPSSPDRVKAGLGRCSHDL